MDVLRPRQFWNGSSLPLRTPLRSQQLVPVNGFDAPPSVHIIKTMARYGQCILR